MGAELENIATPWQAASKLADFMGNVPIFTRAEQETVLDVAAGVLAAHYAHLPQKRELHGVDAPELIRSLRADLGRLAGPRAFHAELAARFAECRDLHTTYVLPQPFAGHIAFLPFQVALLAGEDRARVLVTHVVEQAVAAPFGPGCEIVEWNGAPVDQAIEALAAISGGANPAAATARAVAALTQRPMQRMAPPEGFEVEIAFRPPGAAAGDAPVVARFEWRVSDVQADPGNQVAGASVHDVSLDEEGDALRRHRLAVFAPHILAAERAGVVPGAGAARLGHPFEEEIPTPILALRAWQGQADGRRFGYLRIRSFKMGAAGPWLAEVARLLRVMPQEGVIIDVRDNSGGLVEAAERMLQFLTDTPISPMRMQFLATPENLELCRMQSPGAPTHRPTYPDLSAWVASLADPQGRAWSDALPMTAVELCRDTGRIYPGPVVLVTSALCYSACDMFVAGFADHAIGPILGVDDNIGAGGANVWTYDQLLTLRGQKPGAGGVLPRMANLRFAVRRALRANGDPLEELGVTPTRVHVRTERDLLDGNPDLIAAAARLLG